MQTLRQGLANSGKVAVYTFCIFIWQQNLGLCIGIAISNGFDGLLDF